MGAQKAYRRTILIVDDHPIIREGLRAALSQGGWDVVGEAENEQSAVAYVELHSPDMALIDLSQPGMDAVEVTRKLRQCSSTIGVIIFTNNCNPESLIKAFEAGALGYVSKRSPLEKLFEGMEVVASGRPFIDSSLSNAVVGGLRIASTPEAARSHPLTPREREIAVLLAEGLSCREIGERLFISRKTVDNHRGRILKKLGVSNVIELVRYAVCHDLVDLELWKKNSSP